MTDPLCSKCNGIAEHAEDCEDRLLYLRPPALRFTGDEAQAAWEKSGFNCGPGALCGVLQLRPEQVLPHLRDFDRKRYTNPKMLYAALQALGVRYTVKGNAHGSKDLPWPKLGFVRIQWGGRWMQPGVPLAARYRKTHWVGSWIHPSGTLAVFDVNVVDSGGWVNLDVWESQVVPHLTRHVKGCDGSWLMTHAVEVVHG